MINAEQWQRHAESCLKRARSSATLRERVEWVSLAHACMDMARDIDQEIDRLRPR